MKRSTSDLLLGVAVGVIVMINLTWGLYSHGFMRWSAMLLGLLAGLEAGFWAGAWEKTLSVHRAIWRVMRSTRDEILIVSGIFSGLCAVILMSILVASTISYLDTGDIFAKNIELKGYILAYFWISLLMSVVCVGFVTSFYCVGSGSEKFRAKSNIYKVTDMSLFRNHLIMAFVVPVVIAFMGLGGWVIPAAYFVARYGVQFTIFCLRALVELCFDHSNVTLVLGIVIGGFVGLMVHGINYYDFSLVLVECVVGVIVGCASALVLTKLGELSRFERAISTL